MTTGERVIGGTFGLAQAPVPQGRPLFARGTFLANGTSALGVLLRALGVERVWLPSYLCVALVRAAEYAGTRVAFYAVDGTLTIADDAWLKDVRAGDAVAFIRYFGFDFPAAVAAAAGDKGAVVIEDCAQALFSDAPSSGNFAVFSPRKFLGVVDGGVLVGRRDADLPPLERAPADWWMAAFRASLLRACFDRHGGEREWFAAFREAEESAPVGPFAMSELSRTLLDTAFDYGAIRRQRAENYDRLAAALGDVALFPKRPANVVPLGFPIRVRDRDAVRQQLFERAIFPPVHWDLRGVVPADFVESHRLSSEIMTLPCDQRYDVADMDRTIDALRAAR